MRSMALIVLIFTVFTIAVNAQELVPATSEDQDMFDQQLEQAKTEPVKKSAAATKERKSRFGSLIKEEASKLQTADTATRTNMGQGVAAQKRKNPAASGAAATTTTSTGSDGKNSAPGLNNSGTRGNSGKSK